MRILLASALVILTGCQTIRRGPTQTITIATNPPGALATAEPGGQHVTTPGAFALRRKGSYSIRVEKAGYQTQTLALNRRSDSEFWRNLIWIHPLAWIAAYSIDVGNGSAYVLEPEQVTIDLRK
jgi:hypothetical protein